MTKYTGFYHGAGTRIEAFKFDFTGIGNDEIGSGFYFTSSPKEALTYATARLRDDLPKPGGEDNPTVHEVIISANKLLQRDATGIITKAQARAMCEGSPRLEEALENWGDVEYEGRQKVFNRMVDSFAFGDGEPVNLLRRLFCFANDVYGGTPSAVEAFNRAVNRVFGYDGVIQEHRDSTGQLISTHICAFFPEQIQIVARTPVEEFRAQMEERAKQPQPTPAARPRRP